MSGWKREKGTHEMRVVTLHIPKVINIVRLCRLLKSETI